MLIKTIRSKSFHNNNLSTNSALQYEIIIEGYRPKRLILNIFKIKYLVKLF